MLRGAIVQPPEDNQEATMVVRMWHGRVPTAKAQRYREFLNARAIPDYRSVPGNVSVHILEREDGPVTHFMTMTFWKNMTAIKGFAGDDVETAKYYPEDRDFLLEYEPTVVHYEVVGEACDVESRTPAGPALGPSTAFHADRD
jgi:heme-degrading monooxygenase HmoA